MRLNEFFQEENIDSNFLNYLEKCKDWVLGPCNAEVDEMGRKQQVRPWGRGRGSQGQAASQHSEQLASAWQARQDQNW